MTPSRLYNDIPPRPVRSVTGCAEFDYAPGQPNLYRMMRFKQDLVRAHGVERAFKQYRQTFGLPADARLVRMRVERERTSAEQGGAFFVETAPSGVPFVNPPPEIVGAGNHVPLSGSTRSQYVACFDEVEVAGRSALIRTGATLLQDLQGSEGARFDDEIEWDPCVFCPEGPDVWYIDRGGLVPPLEIEQAFSLLGAHTDFFGHWMAEYLPRYVAARLSGTLPEVPVLVDADMPASHRESLEVLYGASIALVEVEAFRPVRVGRLWSAPALSYWPLHEIRNARFSWEDVSASGERFVPIVRELQARFDASTTVRSRGAENVYLARRSFRHRRLVNSEVIEQIARQFGVAVRCPEDLSFAEQAALVRDARLIIAPEGSALFLAMFACPGTTVWILSHPFTEPLADYEALLAPHGIRVTVLTGPIARLRRSAPNDSDYEIDGAMFRRRLKDLLSR